MSRKMFLLIETKIESCSVFGEPVDRFSLRFMIKAWGWIKLQLRKYINDTDFSPGRQTV